jgi:hypothetical protein
MKRGIFALGVLLAFACSKTELTTQSPTNITQKPIAIILDSIKITGRTDTLIISKSFKFTITGYYSDKTTKDLSDSVNVLSDKSNVTINGKSIIGAQSGMAVLNITYKNFTVKDNIYVSEIEYLTVDPKLKSNGKGKIIVPVVIINYLPTIDGVLLDMLKAPDGYYDVYNSTLERSKNKIFGDKVIEKNVIEEGTRFRDYSTNKIEPYISIDVVAYINIYEVDYAKDPDRNGTQIINWNTLFNKINMKEFVEKNGVKEVWFTAFPKDGYPSVLKQPNPTDKSLWYNMPESNMSSPITGDVSNSSRFNNDLPIYSKTYVVYGFNAHRGADTDLHNRGHQIEAQLSHIDRDLIWNNAFLPTSTKKEFRLGNCHWPPNATSDYDYGNKVAVKSDIASYQPSGGTYIDVNVDTWLGKKYSFPMTATNIIGVSNYDNDAQVKWFIYWWQSIPGLNNTIPYNNSTLTNWWDIFYNWDDAIKNKTKLVK